MVDKWMQGVHPKPGALHKQLRIPEGQKIPTSTLQDKAHSPKSSLLLKRRANLALRYRGKADGGVNMPCQMKRKVRFGE